MGLVNLESQALRKQKISDIEMYPMQGKQRDANGDQTVIDREVAGMGDKHTSKEEVGTAFQDRSSTSSPLCDITGVESTKNTKNATTLIGESTDNNDYDNPGIPFSWVKNSCAALSSQSRSVVCLCDRYRNSGHQARMSTRRDATVSTLSGAQVHEVKSAEENL